MSTHAANSLISDLAEMVKAVEELPQVQQELEAAHDQITAQQRALENADNEISELHKELATLQASLKQAEANRDDAELRFLEIEDRFSKLASAVTGAHSLVAVANAVAEPQGEVTQAKADPTATTVSITEPTSATGPNDASVSPIGTMINTPASEGVSVPADPTNASASAPDTSFGAAAEPSAASTQAEWPQLSEASPVPLQSSPVPILSTIPEVAASANGSANPSADVGGVQALPYEGKAYSEAVGYEHGRYIPLSEWTKGGGTEDNYYR